MQNVPGNGNVRCKAPEKYSVARTLDEAEEWQEMKLERLARARSYGALYIWEELWVFPNVRFLFSPVCMYVCMYFYQYGLMDIYCIL